MKKFVEADPYPWPFNGCLEPGNTVFLIIDMQTDFCGPGGYVDKMGYDLSLTRAPIGPIQNVLLAARALGYGGVLTSWHIPVEAEIRALLGIPEEVFVAGAITLGRPEGHHGPVRRRPLAELVYGETWGKAPAWAVDPPGTAFTAAGPPRTA